MDLFWGISLIDLNIDLTEVISDINELEKLNNIGVSWRQTYSISSYHKNFGFENFKDESKVNQENGIEILLHTLSVTASNIFTEPHKQYCQRYGIPYKDFSYYFFTRLNEGGSEIDIYDDASKENPKTVSFKYFINEDFEGGEFEFSCLGIKISPKAGQLLIHPSNYIYRYIEKPVTSGVKYQLNAWI